ncbi:ABC transporter ATP-binding - Pr1 [Mesomycoplasma hyopneumoniae 7422]|nr:ABC transporter ATP-binding - Pr1 [Mesomycoplasma hyopneumoniae 7422]
MKLFQNTIQILKQDKKNNFIIFLLQIIFLTLLNLHFYSYSFIVGFVKKKVPIQDKNFILWLLISSLSFVFFIIFKLIYVYHSNKTTFKIFKKNTNRLSENIRKKTYEEILKNKETYISFYNLNLDLTNSLSMTIYSHLFKGVIYIISSTIFIFLLSTKSWILVLHSTLGATISVILLFKFSPLITKLQSKIQQLFQSYAGKQIKLFGLFNLFYFFNKRNIFTKYLKSQLLEKYSREFGLLKNFQYKTFLLNSGFSFFVLSNSITLSVLTYYKTFDVTLFISLFSMNLVMVTGFSSFFTYLLTAQALNPYVNKIFEKIDTKNEKKIVLQELISEINLQNLNFSYNPETRVFSNLNLSFEKNKKYAIISPSGKGKSSLLRLISGVLTNYEGKILINNSIEYKELDPKQLRKHIALTTNENIIFEDTLANNITLWDKNPDLDLLNSLIKKYKIDNFSKPETEISSKNLSEGEKQKVALARLEYKNLDIWCLDEALDNIFKEDAFEIYSDLLSKPNKTIFIASHHIPEKIKPMFDQIIEI